MFNFSMLIFLLMNLVMIMLMIFISELKFFHPMFFTILMIIYIVFLCLNMNYFNSNYWFSYLLFLILIGGLMILFMYFTSIANNNIFMFNYMYYFNLSLKFLFLMLMIFFMFNFNEKNYLNNFYKEIYMMMNNFINLNNLEINYLYMDFFMTLNFIMIIYLFITMISCILICLKMMIPFRQMNYYE